MLRRVWKQFWVPKQASGTDFGWFLELHGKQLGLAGMILGSFSVRPRLFGNNCSQKARCAMCQDSSTGTVAEQARTRTGISK